MPAHVMTVTELREFSEDYARDNLKEGCMELVVRIETSILPEGHIRSLASMWHGLGIGSTLAVAESFFVAAAIKRIARGE